MFNDLQLWLAAQPTDTAPNAHTASTTLLLHYMEQQKRGSELCAWKSVRHEPGMQYLSARTTRVQRLMTPVEQRREPRPALLQSTETAPISAIVLDHHAHAVATVHLRESPRGGASNQTHQKKDPLLNENSL